MRSVLLGVLLMPVIGLAEVPNTLSYQGRLLRQDGAPESGAKNIKFSIFDSASAGSELWTETQSVALSDGYYAVRLGEGTALPGALFSGADRYLEVAVGDPLSPLSPRQRIASAPYAISAGTSLNLSGGTVNATSVTVGGANGTTVTSAGISIGGTTIIDSSGQLAMSSVDTAKLQSRLKGTCSGGMSIGGVAQDGTVSCTGGAGAFIQNQSAAAQNASFNISGSGYFAGEVGIGTAVPAAKLHAVEAAPVAGAGTVGINGTAFAVLVGAQTTFKSQVAPGDVVEVNTRPAQTRIVASVVDDSHLTVTFPYPTGFTGTGYTIRRPIARLDKSTGGAALSVDALGNVAAAGRLSSAGGSVKRDFLTWNTTARTATHVHIKTNIPIHSNIMYRLLVEGYNFGTGLAINSDAVGYTWMETVCMMRNSVNNYATGATLSQYCSTDGYVVLRLTVSDSYYIGFSVSGWFVNPAGTAFDVAGDVYYQDADL